jgi:tripartite ATP-independent transporter DctP family solute receptor
MTALDRRRVLALSLGAAVATPAILRTTRVRGAEFEFKLSTNDAATHPTSARTTEAAGIIRKETNGKVDIQVFPNSQLGSNTDMLSQLRSGALEFGLLSPLIISILVPQASIMGVGFAWPNYDKVWAAVDGELGNFGREQVRKAGIYVFDKTFDNGYRHISSSTKPIVTPDDLKGMKIRVPVSPLWTSMFKAFEASPMSININETYSALQTKIAEGQENPFVIIYTQKLFEVQKYISKTGHMWDGYWLLANGKMWDGLPSEVRDVIQRHMNAGALKERADILQLNQDLEKEIGSKGVAISEVNRDLFRQKLQSAGFYKEWRGKYGEEAWALLEKYAGQIS